MNCHFQHLKLSQVQQIPFSQSGILAGQFSPVLHVKFEAQVLASTIAEKAERSDKNKTIIKIKIIYN